VDHALILILSCAFVLKGFVKFDTNDGQINESICRKVKKLVTKKRHLIQEPNYLLSNMSLSEYLKDLPAKDKANFTNIPNGDSKNGAARSSHRSKPPVYVPTTDHQPEQVGSKKGIYNPDVVLIHSVLPFIGYCYWSHQYLAEVSPPTMGKRTDSKEKVAVIRGKSLFSSGSV
jgi:hypothetical protein